MLSRSDRTGGRGLRDPHGRDRARRGRAKPLVRSLQHGEREVRGRLSRRKTPAAPTCTACSTRRRPRSGLAQALARAEGRDADRGSAAEDPARLPGAAVRPARGYRAAQSLDMQRIYRHHGGKSMKTSGLVHLYCGDGKGKTTAAVGLAVRRAGRGGQGRVRAVSQGRDSSGECRVLAKLARRDRARGEPGRQVHLPHDGRGEARRPPPRSPAPSMPRPAMPCGSARRLLVLDEVCAAVNVRLSARERRSYGLSREPSPDTLEVVLTGRGPSAKRLHGARGLHHGNAETQRHPYEKGVAAREGIEF